MPTLFTVQTDKPRSRIKRADAPALSGAPLIPSLRFQYSGFLQTAHPHYCCLPINYTQRSATLVPISNSISLSATFSTKEGGQSVKTTQVCLRLRHRNLPDFG